MTNEVQTTQTAVWRLSFTGSLDIAIPEEVARALAAGDDGADEMFDEWKERALLTALDSGDFTEAVEIGETEVGRLREDGWLDPIEDES